MSHPPQDQHLAARYGAARKVGLFNNRRAVWVIAVVAVLGALIWAASLTFFKDTGPKNPQDITFTVNDAASAVSSFSVVPDAHRDIACTVVAKNQYEAIVGYAQVTVPADPQTDGQTPAVQTVTVNTVQLAHQGHLERCAFIG